MSETQDTTLDHTVVIEVFLKLTSLENLKDVSIDMISAESEIPLSLLSQTYPDTESVMDAYFEQVNETVLSNFVGDDDESTREKLFDIIMQYFDELNRHKAALINIDQTVSKSPQMVIKRRRDIAKLMASLLEACGVATNGLRGQARVQSLLVIFVLTTHKWLKDETTDMAKTMKELDGHLAKAEELENSITCKWPKVKFSA